MTSDEGGSVELKSCNFDGESADDKKACQVPVEHYEECTKENKFGYHKGEPCILIKLNKVICEQYALF